jgi:hypothetical protein
MRLERPALYVPTGPSVVSGEPSADSSAAAGPRPSVIFRRNQRRSAWVGPGQGRGPTHAARRWADRCREGLLVDGAAVLLGPGLHVLALPHLAHVEGHLGLGEVGRRNELLDALELMRLMPMRASLDRGLEEYWRLETSPCSSAEGAMSGGVAGRAPYEPASTASQRPATPISLAAVT